MTRCLLAVVLLAACAERYPDTPKLVEARNRAAAAATPGRVQTSGPPEELTRNLTGGKKVLSEDFERAELGPRWKPDAPAWKITEGELTNNAADNAGCWLLDKLPDGDLRIEFDARSMPFTQWVRGEKKETFPGDLKCEAFALEPAHQQGYIFIFGGWSNTRNRIARVEEHGEGAGAWVVDGPKKAVEPGHTYRMKVVRVGKTIGFFADDQYLIHAVDDQFIEGRYFGFNNWRSDLHFDNLAVYQLDGTGQKAAPKAAPTTPRGGTVAPTAPKAPGGEEPPPENPGN